MHKRFTDCDKYEDSWFRKLPSDLKVFWDYLCCKCDNSGVWKPDMELASFMLGITLEEKFVFEGLNKGKSRVTLLPSGRWLINDFIQFQYGQLSTACHPHRKVLSLIKENEIEGYLNPSVRVQEKEEDKDKDKEEDKEGRGLGKPKRKKDAGDEFIQSINGQERFSAPPPEDFLKLAGRK